MDSLHHGNADELKFQGTFQLNYTIIPLTKSDMA
jgi:hypothetical protein